MAMVLSRRSWLRLPIALLLGATVKAAKSNKAVEEFSGTLGIGRAGTAAAIARWDIDVLPDGTGLPAGAGTAAEGAAIYAAQCA